MKKGIPVNRLSQDSTHVNKYGQKLIELCKRCSIYIANGRLSNDKNIGKTKCKDASLVDYLLLSSSLFDQIWICEFDVIDYNPMFSDAHNRLHFSIIASPPIQNNSNNKNTITYIKWNSEKAENFTRSLINDNNGVLNRLRWYHTLQVKFDLLV